MRILYATDIHYDATPERPHYPKALQYQEKFWDYVKRAMPDYDLFVAGGDLTVKGPACIRELEEFKQKLESITSAYIAVPGNHDFCPIKGMEKTYPGVEEYEYKPIDQTNYGNVFQTAGLRYSRVFEDLRLVAFAIRDEDPDGQCDWLVQELEKPEQKLVFAHYPVFQTRSGGFCEKWDYNRIGKVREKIASLLISKAHRVLGYFCGHQHINSKVPMRSIKDTTMPESRNKPKLALQMGDFDENLPPFQIETGAATQATCVVRSIKIVPDAIHVKVHSILGPLQMGEGIMNVDRSNDREHTDLLSYHMGLPMEQDFIIHR